MDRMDQIVDIIADKHELFKKVHTMLNEITDKMLKKNVFGPSIPKVEKNNYDFRIVIGRDVIAVVSEQKIIGEIKKYNKNYREITEQWLETTMLDIIEKQL